MNPTSVDIADILEAESSLGLVFATNLFVGEEPAVPDNCVTIFDTPGFAPQLTFVKGENYYYPSIQLRIRNNSYVTGWQLINDIKVLLHGMGQFTVDDTHYSLIRCSIEPAFLDWDMNRRARFVATFDVQRR